MDVDDLGSVRVELNCQKRMTSTHMAVRGVGPAEKAHTMHFLTEIVRRATRQNPEPKARVRGKSPRARLRGEALSMLA
jgi:hypothetical protein